MTRRALLGRVLVVAGAVGLVATTAGTVLGLVVLGELDRSLQDSVTVTADAVTALATTVEVADVVVDDAASALFDAGLAASAAADGAGAAVDVLAGAADVTGRDVAPSLAAVEDALPALVDVAAVIDGTLGALDRLPVGPTYDPDVPFDDALREVQAELDGLPESLEEQADLLRTGATELSDVERAATFLAEDLETLSRSLREAGATLEDVARTADDAATVLADGSRGLGGGVASARVLVGVAGTALAVGQLLPLLGGWFLLDPERVRTFLAAPVKRTGAGRAAGE